MPPPRASRPPPRRPWSSALLVALGTAACAQGDWSAGQRSEAVRMCRGPMILAPIDVFREDGRSLAAFMCECQVDHLAARLPHAALLSPFHVEEVNAALADARAECLQRYRRLHPGAGAGEGGGARAGGLPAAGFWRP